MTLSTSPNIFRRWPITDFKMAATETGSMEITHEAMSWRHDSNGYPYILDHAEYDPNIPDIA